MASSSIRVATRQDMLTSNIIIAAFPISNVAGDTVNQTIKPMLSFNHHYFYQTRTKISDLKPE